MEEFKMQKLITRKQNRLKNYNYSLEGYYFVTICSFNRQNIFGEIGKNQLILNEYGNLVKIYIQEIPIKYTNIQFDQYIIMPNHVHLIINIVGTIHESSETNDSNNNIELTRAIHELPLRRNMFLSKMVGYIKMRSAKHINLLRNTPKKPVWQRSFHDHIIRNERSLIAIRKYIETNPENWENDIDNLINL